ncbi:unnamed protein product [Angiostrongylus costaricensis]|uniref:aECM cysteine-cradle domain-containing protein n=1 Tax=Angiostrongylus costaricensis TaxID=334426 RepID=A0A0R3PX72_ANGCS|nr:unnamed protein product [Angiostrongylus costaricensis]
MYSEGFHPLAGSPRPRRSPAFPSRSLAKSKPIPGPTTVLVTKSYEETCTRIHHLASTFGISDVSSYARQNCRLLQLLAPGFTCEQIIYFVNSCHKSLSIQQGKAK